MCARCEARGGASVMERALSHKYDIVRQGGRYAVRHDGESVYTSPSARQCVAFLERLFRK
jgi:hypothetical protein